MSKEKIEPPMSQAQMEWVSLNSELKAMRGESFPEKFRRKFKENPFVPIGCFVTAGVLTFGIMSMRRGNSQMSQYMMRLRVACQGLTVVALIGGVMYHSKS